MAINLTGTVKEIVGTAVSLGCTIDGKKAKEITADIVSGELKCE